MNEAAVTDHGELEAARLGAWMLRNNSGALPDKTGRPVRFGLGNISKDVNDRIKSPDYAGIMPVLITPEMVGQTVGVFVGIEYKETGWHLTPGDAHCQAQAEFHRVARLHGGRSGFATCVEDVRAILTGGIGAL
jgi:hypothetical protein